MDEFESTSFMAGLASVPGVGPGLASLGNPAMIPGFPAGGGFMNATGMPQAPAAVPPGVNPFPGAAELIPAPMPTPGGSEPAEVATNQLGVGVTAAAAIGVLLGCVFFRRGGNNDDDSDEDLESDESK